MKLSFKEPVAVLILFTVAALIRILANAINNAMDGMAALVLLFVLMLVYAFCVFFAFSAMIVKIYEKEYLQGGIIALTATVSGIAVNLILNGYDNFTESVLPIIIFVGAAYLVSFAANFILKNKTVFFFVSVFLFICLNVIISNEMTATSVSSAGMVFPNLRISSDMGYDTGLVAYVLYPVIFGAHYFIYYITNKRKAG